MSPRRSHKDVHDFSSFGQTKIVIKDQIQDFALPLRECVQGGGKLLLHLRFNRQILGTSWFNRCCGQVNAKQFELAKHFPSGEIYRGQSNDRKEPRFEARPTFVTSFAFQDFYVHSLQNFLRLRWFPVATVQCSAKAGSMMLFQLVSEL